MAVNASPSQLSPSQLSGASGATSEMLDDIDDALRMIQNSPAKMPQPQPREPEPALPASAADGAVGSAARRHAFAPSAAGDAAEAMPPPAVALEVSLAQLPLAAPRPGVRDSAAFEFAPMDAAPAAHRPRRTWQVRNAAPQCCD